MAQYRVYQMDERGHITGRIDLTCTDDDDARRQAAQLLDGTDLELWQEARRIALFTAKKDVGQSDR
ncbi:hypothetical protein [Bradyrhizobium sp. SBR1B]|uniref:hypothetical protein n=1 Tax=Bradyrhizobium sp. SBR1B TaxID=2663836 RepID=UPI001605C57B|nr:hypothetical protein [Bradyrhizobium sp. SBR1B]MBB4382963.1 hypothetical protein [Bradyrhizobium sp. SBR1B]